MIEDVLPFVMNFSQQRHRKRQLLRQKLFLGVAFRRNGKLAEFDRAAQVSSHGVEHLKLIADGTADIEKFAGIGVFADLVQRNHDVFIQFKGVGMLRGR